MHRVDDKISGDETFVLLFLSEVKSVSRREARIYIAALRRVALGSVSEIYYFARDCFSSFHNNSMRRFAQDFVVRREFTVMIDPSMRRIYYFGKQSPRFFLLPSPKDSVYCILRGISHYHDRALFQNEIDFWRNP